MSDERPLMVPGAALAAYHGYARNQGSLLWGSVWAFFGYSMPIIVVGIALVQGYAKPKGT